MMPLAHGAGHTGCSWDKSWSKGIEQHVADASGPVAAGPVVASVSSGEEQGRAAQNQ